MAQQIVKQPSGKYAIYSSVTESIVGLDFTAEELQDHYANGAAQESRARVQVILDKINADVPAYYQFTKKWEDVKHTVPEELLKTDSFKEYAESELRDGDSFM